ncbi:MAG: hypothetical protein FWC68_06330, partial [Oscillospiraceae bacterium]|nr:hypothetical protein [Oscillospiraceae bacterium]
MKKLTKKLVIITLSLFLAFAIIACSSNDEFELGNPIGEITESRAREIMESWLEAGEGMRRQFRTNTFKADGTNLFWEGRLYFDDSLHDSGGYYFYNGTWYGSRGLDNEIEALSEAAAEDIIEDMLDGFFRYFVSET